MTVGSLFAGIGGFDLGFERAGYEILWQVEIDEYCRRVLAKNFPKSERFGDIRECGKHNLKSVNVICGGFPCQPFSCAGERKGEGDSRFLWPEMFRIISELRPAFIVAENVPFFATLESGKYLNQVYCQMESIGYEAIPPIIIPACAFGAGHRRDRLWIIAHAHSHGQRRIQSQQRKECEKEMGPTRVSKERLTANSHSERELQPERLQQDFWRWPDNGNWWDAHKGLLDMDDGIPASLDEIRGFGNAIVPQIAQWIAEKIKQVEANRGEE